jgi:hypothetical protein
MACEISAGYTLGCRDNTGGIRNIYILSGSISGVTLDANDEGLITDIAGSGIWYTYQIVKGTGNFTETTNTSIENGTTVYEQVVEAPFHKMQSVLRNQIRVLAKNSAIKVVVETQNGTVDGIGRYFLIGQFNGATLTGGTGTTGTALSDMNAYTLQFTGMEPEPAREIDDFPNALTGQTID